MNTVDPKPREESGVLGGPQVEPVDLGWRPPAETSLNHNGFPSRHPLALSFLGSSWALLSLRGRATNSTTSLVRVKDENEPQGTNKNRSGEGAMILNRKSPGYPLTPDPAASAS
jgi:hypothetical protein